MSLTFLAVIVVLFTVFAVRNWKKQIGAGPTILIIGSILLFAFGVLKYVQYDSAKDAWNVCMGRVDRSTQGYAFNSELVKILDEELPERPFADRLRVLLPEPLLPESCGLEPKFFIDFDQGDTT